MVRDIERLALLAAVEAEEARLGFDSYDYFVDPVSASDEYDRFCAFDSHDGYLECLAADEEVA